MMREGGSPRSYLGNVFLDVALDIKALSLGSFHKVPHADGVVATSGQQEVGVWY